MKPILILFALLSLAGIAAGQNTKYPLLSQKDMYQDYDTLVKTLLEVSPQPSFRKKLTGFDVTVFYRENRLKIKSIRSTEEFYQLVRSTVTANQDSHTSVLRPGLMPADYLKSQGISAAAIDNMAAYGNLFNAPANGNHLNLELRYMDGCYYNMRSFVYKGKFYKAGLQLAACNGKPINIYVNGLHPYLNMKWDVSRHQYFADNFFKSFNLSANDHLLLKFKGDAIVRSFNIADSVKFTDVATAAVRPAKAVIYFADLKVLYIRMPAMTVEDTSYYPAQILKYKDKSINKVVFDIRGNRGGGDGVWRNALSAIINKDIIITETLIMNKSDKIRSLFAGQFDASKTVSVPFLKNKSYYISYQGNDTIPKGKSSLNYSGHIYVMQDKFIYSSAGAFSTVSNMAKNLYTVGETTGAQLGIGVNAAVYELPHSKIIYRVEPLIDYTDVKKPTDILHDHVKIPVKLNLPMLLKIAGAKDRYSTSFLLHNDPYFKAVLNN